jgi:cell division protein FtsB
VRFKSTVAALVTGLVVSTYSPISSASETQTATSMVPLPAPAPVKRDNQIPTITGLKFVTSGDSKKVTIDVQLDARFNINTIESIAIGIGIKGAAITPINPLFADKCTALKSFSAAKNSALGELASLQKRVLSGSGYLETHVLQSVTIANPGEDICPGEYVLNSIAIRDVAAHTINLNATTSVSSGGRSTVTATPSMNSNVWAEPTAANLAAGFAGYPCAQVPGASASARVICNQSVTMGQAVFIVKSAQSAITPLNSAQRIVDYQKQLEPLAAENKELQREIEKLTARLTILQRIRAGDVDTSTPVAIVDFQAKSKELQTRVDALTKEIATLQASLAKAKGVVSKKPTPKATKKATPKATPKATSRSSSQGSGGLFRGNSPQGNSNSRITPNPRASSSWKPSNSSNNN